MGTSASTGTQTLRWTQTKTQAPTWATAKTHRHGHRRSHGHRQWQSQRQRHIGKDIAMGIGTDKANGNGTSAETVRMARTAVAWAHGHRQGQGHRQGHSRQRRHLHRHTGKARKPPNWRLPTSGLQSGRTPASGRRRCRGTWHRTQSWSAGPWGTAWSRQG